ncbi:MAG: pyridoxamine 5'-phosphate oxidase family protein [Halieaceae bacterium]|jgi:PPOX class probable FMN-dependent enzyme|nr:pyridoxamine 5'-phosphate oxidase family protein [Halieaceae bacterium]
MNYNWKTALEAAIKRNRRDAHHRYLQLATLREDGSPANRTLVFRGFAQDSDCLQMVTDARSEKPDQIRRDARAEICWYFTGSREQFRLQGSLSIVAGTPAEEPAVQDARRALWSALSGPARAQFFWAAPGQPVEVVDELPQTDAVPDHFLLLVFDPFRVDHLRLAADPQQRRLSLRKAGEWQAQAVNP